AREPREDIVRRVRVEGELGALYHRYGQPRLGGGLHVSPIRVRPEPRRDRGRGAPQQQVRAALIRRRRDDDRTERVQRLRQRDGGHERRVGKQHREGVEAPPERLVLGLADGSVQRRLFFDEGQRA